MWSVYMEQEGVVFVRIRLSPRKTVEMLITRSVKSGSLMGVGRPTTERM